MCRGVSRLGELALGDVEREQHVDRDDVAERAAGEELVDRDHPVVAAVVVVLDAEPLVLVGHREHRTQLVGGRRDRLLDDDVRAGAQRVQRDRVVRRRWGEHVHDVGSGLGEERQVIGVRRRSVALGRPACRGGRAIADADQLDARVRGEHVKVFLGDPATSDDRGSRLAGASRHHPIGSARTVRTGGRGRARSRPGVTTC